MSNSIIWAVLVFFVVAITEYFTSTKLRRLSERIRQSEEQTAELQGLLNQASEQEEEVKAESEKLMTKLATIRNINLNLERTLDRAQDQTIASGEKES